MTRDELLNELKSVEFCAVPTVMTMDMGIQYDYVYPEGAGSGFGGMGMWPAYFISGIENGKWIEIKQKLKSEMLTVDDLEGTELGIFANNLFEDYYGACFRTIDLNDMLRGLIDLPDDLPDRIYILFDMGDIGYEGHRPEFYIHKKDLLEAFQDAYCTDIEPWDEMGTEELQEWYERIDDEFDEFPMCCYESV